MKDVDQIANDAYLIKQPLHSMRFPADWWVGILVFLGKNQIGLVDTGFEKTPEEYIFPLLEELGRDKQEITSVVITHRDGDHVQGNKAIRANTKAQIAAHELELEAIPDVDITLKEGDTVELGDRTFQVIHTPGHRPGAICLYDPKSSLLITSDAVCGETKELIRMDKNLYIASLKKLLTFKTKQLVMGHPFKPFDKSLLIGNEPRQMLEASISIAEAM